MSQPNNFRQKVFALRENAQTSKPSRASAAYLKLSIKYLAQRNLYFLNELKIRGYLTLLECLRRL